jgi:hypothetical protein
LSEEVDNPGHRLQQRHKTKQDQGQDQFPDVGLVIAVQLIAIPVKTHIYAVVGVSSTLLGDHLQPKNFT